MSDKEKLSKLLTDFGIGFDEDANYICLEVGKAKTTGCGGFLTEFDFDENGKFVDVGITV